MIVLLRMVMLPPSLEIPALSSARVVAHRAVAHLQGVFVENAAADLADAAASPPASLVAPLLPSKVRLFSL